MSMLRDPELLAIAQAFVEACQAQGFADAEVHEIIDRLELELSDV